MNVHEQPLMEMAGAGEPRRGGGLGPYYEESSEERRSFFVPAVVVANLVVFVVTMYVNDCPSHRTPFGPCIAVNFLHRFSFQPLRQNPLFGPSASTYCHPPPFSDCQLIQVLCLLCSCMLVWFLPILLFEVFLVIFVEFLRWIWGN